MDFGPKLSPQNQLEIYFLTVRGWWLGMAKLKTVLRSILNPSIKHDSKFVFNTFFFWLNFLLTEQLTDRPPSPSLWLLTYFLTYWPMASFLPALPLLFPLPPSLTHSLTHQLTQLLIAKATDLISSLINVPSYLRTHKWWFSVDTKWLQWET